MTLDLPTVVVVVVVVALVVTLLLTFKAERTPIMTMNGRTILLLLAWAMFVLAAFGVPSRVAWQPIGLACLAAALLFT